MEPPDGILRRTSLHNWAGTLHGYQVQVFYCNESWHYHIADSKGHTPVCPRAESFADAARKAREWIERTQQVESEASILRDLPSP